MIAAIRWAVEQVAGVLAPEACAACSEPIALRTAFCSACVATIERASSNAIAPFVYGGAVARAICRFKFERRGELARQLAPFASEAFRRREIRIDVVVPVPLHVSKLRQRGFNPAALIAGRVASDLQVAWEPRGLLRVLNTRSQVGLAREERLANLKGAFAIRPRLVNRFVGKSVLLVDDVRSTGTTMRECGEILLANAASAIHELAIAQADG